MQGIEILHGLLNRSPGPMVQDGDRLCGTQVAPAVENRSKDQVLLVRLDGSYFIESFETASMAAVSDPDFVVAIPLSTLRPLLSRAVN